MSPAMAAAAAVTGRLTDVRKLMARGARHGSRSTRLEAVALPIARPNVDTDQIVPARYLQKPRADNFGDYLFRDLRFRADGIEDPAFVLNQPAYRDARIVVAERNFGCGSSREHAVWALYDYGFRAVIAPSVRRHLRVERAEERLAADRAARAAVVDDCSMRSRRAAGQRAWWSTSSADGAWRRTARRIASTIDAVLEALPARRPRRDRLHAEPVDQIAAFERRYEQTV